VSGFLGVDPDRVRALRATLDDLDLRLARLESATRSEGAAPIVDATREIRSLLHECRDAVLDVARSWFVGTMAAIAVDAWSRPESGWWIDRLGHDATTADTVLRRLRGDPVAIDVFASRIHDVAALTWGGIDGEATLAFWLEATDPDRVDEATAGRLIRALVDVHLGEHYWRGGITTATVEDPGMYERERRVRDWLGSIVGPWQLHFTGLASRWDWTPEQGGAALRAILDDADAAASVTESLPRAVERSLRDLPPDRSERRALVDAVAFGIGASGELLGRAAVERSFARSDAIGDLVDLIGFGLPLTRTEQMVVGALESRITERLHDPRVARREADEETRRRSAVAEHAARVYERRATFLPREILNDEIDDLVRAIDSPAHRGDDFAGAL